MKLSLLQPKIIRGDIKANASTIQNLINKASGNIMVLAEYALTGSLVLDETANIKQWATDSEHAIRGLTIPENKQLMINTLVNRENKIYNACCFAQDNSSHNNIVQAKVFPDQPELDAGICAGDGFSILSTCGKNIAIVICSDLRQMDKIPTEGADFILFIFHFTPVNYDEVIDKLIKISEQRKLPVIVASLLSDKNNGNSCYINGSTIVSLADNEGILEITM